MTLLSPLSPSSRLLDVSIVVDLRDYMHGDLPLCGARCMRLRPPRVLSIGHSFAPFQMWCDNLHEHEMEVAEAESHPTALLYPRFLATPARACNACQRNGDRLASNFSQKCLSIGGQPSSSATCIVQQGASAACVVLWA